LELIVAKEKLRVDSLDWLRGLMALSIMLYHLTYFVLFPIESSHLLGRLGIYAVSIFFILSGLSMAIVYNSYFKSFVAVSKFYIRRVFRIWPLFLAACVLILILIFIKTRTVEWGQFFLNIKTLLGFTYNSKYSPTGAWSIGNEMSYYFMTPLVFAVYNYRKWAGNTFFVLCLIVGLVFSIQLLENQYPLSEQWDIYINPLNNLFLYVMGVGIYYNFKDTKVDQGINAIMLLIAIGLFCFLPFDGDQVVLVTGIGRFVFVILSFVIVFCFYKLNIQINFFARKILEKFGLATYGVYLFHPIVLMYSKFLARKVGFNHATGLFVAVSIITIVVSVMSYEWFESKFIKLGKSLT
jgi:exopolysaccharide production protein ExoZ